jgi:poly(3-hydroxybutyrate) depolymerase
MMPPSGPQTIQHNGQMRLFIVRPPTGYDPSKPWPMIFAFHGAGGTAASFQNQHGLLAQLGAKAAFVFPQALTATSGPSAGKTTWWRDTQDDVTFLDDMLAWLETRVCFDHSRVFATGHSSGAFFSHTLGCRRGNVLRAVAPVSGGIRDFVNCTGATPVWMSFGAMDGAGLVMDATAARDYWIKANGCTGVSMPTPPAPCVAYTGCRPDAPLHVCENSGAHAWPAYATDGLWNFFSSL